MLRSGNQRKEMQKKMWIYILRHVKREKFLICKEKHNRFFSYSLLSAFLSRQISVLARNFFWQNSTSRFLLFCFDFPQICLKIQRIRKYWEFFAQFSFYCHRRSVKITAVLCLIIPIGKLLILSLYVDAITIVVIRDLLISQKLINSTGPCIHKF